MAQKRVSASEMLSGLKSRLGFAHDDDPEDEEFSRYDSDFDDYDDFDDDYEQGYAEYEDDYSEEEYEATSSRSSRFGRPDSTPNLVSIDDVREHTRTVIDSPRGSYESAHRDRSGSYVPASASASNSYTSTYQRNSMGRDLIEASGPAVSSPAYNAAQRSNASRSEGLNSLFESSAADTRYATTSAVGDERGITVIKPLTYNDVEGVARALKAGDVVVLAMEATPEDLFKRILDFSFGVASALDAHVDGIGSRVYALANGPELSEGEMARLRTQGVL